MWLNPQVIPLDFHDSFGPAYCHHLDICSSILLEYLMLYWCIQRAIFQHRPKEHGCYQLNGSKSHFLETFRSLPKPFTEHHYLQVPATTASIVQNTQVSWDHRNTLSIEAKDTVLEQWEKIKVAEQGEDAALNCTLEKSIYQLLMLTFCSKVFFSQWNCRLKQKSLRHGRYCTHLSSKERSNAEVENLHFIRGKKRLTGRNLLINSALCN